MKLGGRAAEIARRIRGPGHPLFLSLIGMSLFAGLVALALTVPPNARAQEKLPLVEVRGDAFTVDGKAFNPWGFNVSTLEYFDHPSRKTLAPVSHAMDSIRSRGGTTVRILLELPQVMLGPSKTNKETLRALGRLLRLAEEKNLYLLVTGNIVWRATSQRDWYDTLGERARWRIQEKFWRAVARVGRPYNSVLAYQLISEPLAMDDPTQNWYIAEFGGYYFLQVIARNMHGREESDVAVAWTKQMVQAVRDEDRRHLTTIGLLHDIGQSFDAHRIARQVDFIGTHIYPVEGHLQDSLDEVRYFAAARGPLLMDETFALFCPISDERRFLIAAKPFLDGVLSFHHTTIQLEALSAEGRELYLANLKLFTSMRRFLFG